MADMNVYVDGVALDNGTTRRIFGQFRVNELIGTGINMSCAVLLTAATPLALQQLWDSTKDAFQKKDVRVIFTLDPAAGTPMEDISPLDGKHEEIVCQVSISEAKDNTNTSMWVEFNCSASTSLVTTDGQLGDILCNKVYDAARIVSITASGIYRTTLDETATTGLTLSSVSNSGGKAVFNVASGAPTYVPGMRIKVAGTTNYQAPSPWHIVTGITGNAITTETAYIADDTGTLDVGEAKTGLVNYNAAKGSILTNCLLTDSDGSRNSSSGMALTGETVQVNDDDETCLFSLNSDWMEVEISSSGAGAAARTFNMSIQTSQPQDWQETVAGQRPIIVTAVGSVVFDKDALGRVVRDSDWNTIKSKVESEIRSKTGQQDLKRLDLIVSTSGQTNAINFTASYIGINLDHFAYDLVETEQHQLMFNHWRDADGYHTFQKAPGPDEVIRVITVNRTGPNLVDITPPQPTQTLDGQPAFYVQTNKGFGKQGTFVYDEVDNVYKQQGTYTFMKVNLRPGATASIQDLQLGVI